MACESANQVFEDLHSAESAVIGFDQLPGSIGRTGQGQHLFGGLQIFLVTASLLPIRLIPAPAFEPIVLHARQTALLFLFADVEPELDQHDTIVRELALELTNFTSGRQRSFPVQMSVDAFLQHLSIPGAIPKHQFALSRKPGPEAPKERVELLFESGRLGRIDLESPRVKGAYQRIDRVSLACCVPTLEQDNNRDSTGPHCMLQVSQVLPQTGDCLLVFLLAGIQVKIKNFKHRFSNPSYSPRQWFASHPLSCRSFESETTDLCGLSGVGAMSR